jgi:RNA polymerase sigma factor (sigma-70 family)
MATPWAPCFRLRFGSREGAPIRGGVVPCVAIEETTLTGGRRERALAVLAVAEPEFRRTARRVSLCADDAEDAFQRAVEILLTKAPERPPNALIPWMQVVTRREALAVRRARERLLAAWREDGSEIFDVLLCERPGPMERAERRDRVAAVAQALAELKPDERLAIVLQAQGYSYAEIGELCRWTYTKVNRCLAEGRARLRELDPGVRMA